MNEGVTKALMAFVTPSFPFCQKINEIKYWKI